MFGNFAQSGTEHNVYYAILSITGTVLPPICWNGGTDLWYIQALLGHLSSRTTEIYTHITKKGFENLKSPLDDMDI